MRRCIAVVAAVAAFLLVTTPVATGQTADQRYVTVLFGRTQWVHAENCARDPNSIDLGQVSQALTSRGLTASGNVVLNQTPATGFWCEGGFSLHPGWDRIQTLEQQGWSFNSAGRSYLNMAQATTQQALNNSCGSLPTFNQRGIDASGLFAYPNDKYTTAVQTNPVSTCFGYGRTYGSGVNTRWQMAAPWFQSTHTTQGARCNMPNAGVPVRGTGEVGLHPAILDHRDDPRPPAGPVVLGAVLSLRNRREPRHARSVPVGLPRERSEDALGDPPGGLLLERLRRGARCVAGRAIGRTRRRDRSEDRRDGVGEVSGAAHGARTSAG